MDIKNTRGQEMRLALLGRTIRTGLVQGCALFLVGMAIQFQSHWILAQLRPARSAKNRTVAPLDCYKIPRGGLFEYVSCPHYLGEIVIYAGLLLILRTQSLLPYLTFAWVVSPFFSAQNGMAWHDCHGIPLQL